MSFATACAPTNSRPSQPAADPADFLFIGELRELKGVDVFIEAVAKLREEGHAARAVIVGPATAEDVRRYRELANEKVRGARIAFHTADAGAAGLCARPPRRASLAR